MAALSSRAPTDANNLSPSSKADHERSTLPDQNLENNHHQRHPSTPRSPTSDRSPAEITTTPASTRRHSNSPSTNSIPFRHQRSGTSLFNRATAALDRTQTAFASISEPVVRPRQSNSALSRLSLSPAFHHNSEPGSPNTSTGSQSPSNSSTTTASKTDVKPVTAAAPTADVLLTQPYSETDPSLPAPIRLVGSDKKMHQTSSRLLRMTDDDRPFTRVCCPLFLCFFKNHYTFVLPHHMPVVLPCNCLSD